MIRPLQLALQRLRLCSVFWEAYEKAERESKDADRGLEKRPHTALLALASRHFAREMRGGAAAVASSVYDALSVQNTLPP